MASVNSFIFSICVSSFSLRTSKSSMVGSVNSSYASFNLKTATWTFLISSAVTKSSALTLTIVWRFSSFKVAFLPNKVLFVAPASSSAPCW